MMDRDAQFHDLPCSIADAIFLKLPLTSIHAVCKDWRTRLRDQDFLTEYDLCETRPKQQWILATSGDSTSRMFSVDDKRWENTSIALKVPESEPSGVALEMLACCMGLWCIGLSNNEKLSSVLLCNPVTGRICTRIQLPMDSEKWRFWGISACDSWRPSRDKLVLMFSDSGTIWLYNTEISCWDAVSDRQRQEKLPFFGSMTRIHPLVPQSTWKLEVDYKRCGGKHSGTFDCIPLGRVYSIETGPGAIEVYAVEGKSAAKKRKASMKVSCGIHRKRAKTTETSTPYKAIEQQSFQICSNNLVSSHEVIEFDGRAGKLNKLDSVGHNSVIYQVMFFEA